MIIGLLIQSLMVLITKFTYLFLAWLKVKVKLMSLGAVTVIMLLVGILIFLFPPIPGVPIYFTAGIILVAAGESTFGTPVAILYTCAISLILKLLACTVQQKCIGTPLRRSVKIRQTVGMNSTLIRTMKLVLSKPGISAAKAAILVGCPDWPTSVLCGILDLPLLPILFGTLPVIFIIIPTVLSGSFVYLAEDYEWAGTASAISMSLTGLTILALPAITLFHIEKAMEDEKEELASMPYDEEVILADENEKQKRRVHLEVTKWSTLGNFWRLLLILGSASMSFSCYLVLGTGQKCFEKFTLRDSIEKELGGKPMNLFKKRGFIGESVSQINLVRFLSSSVSALTPCESFVANSDLTFASYSFFPCVCLRAAAIGAFIVGTCILSIFTAWSNKRTQKAMNSGTFNLDGKLENLNRRTNGTSQEASAAKNIT